MKRSLPSSTGRPSPSGPSTARPSPQHVYLEPKSCQLSSKGKGKEALRTPKQASKQPLSPFPLVSPSPYSFHILLFLSLPKSPTFLFSFSQNASSPLDLILFFFLKILRFPQNVGA
ncbi:hypothetical protein I3842_07G114400 [Carya illinoinensis]|uniref:Uncharacterized protein n=1 Tax=Carya illinoinensis TaxID=32201 RepID=A0A922JD56_CARIL|nr:hypothetical protein I3842_07G114400 [Carya illinoinensis]